MDYRDFRFDPKFDKNAPKSQFEGRVGYWWQHEDEADAARLAVTAAKRVQDTNAPRKQMNLICARLYSNYDMVSFGVREYSRSSFAVSVPGTLGNRISYNLISSCIDTLGAKVLKNKPRPSFQTSGTGGWKMQQKARKLNKFVQGLFYETKVYEQRKDIVFDAYTFGTGLMHVYLDGKGKVCVERTFPDEIYVDDADAVNGDPQQMFRVKMVDRSVALARFGDTPARRDAIMNAKMPGSVESQGLGDMVALWEAWHLPMGTSKGRHIVAIESLEGGTQSGFSLVDEPWDFDFFPFVVRRFKKRTRGFWGQGIAEVLMQVQIELNRLLRSVSEQLRRKGKGRIFYPHGSINPDLLDNSIAPAIPYKGGVPPTVDNGAAVAAEEFQQIDRMKQNGYQMIGISELSAAAKKPSGLDAAVALREYNDIETERFSLEMQADEQFFLDFTEIALDLIRKTGGKGYKVRLPNKQFAIDVDWSEIDLKRDDYCIQMFPVSSLPSTPAARLQRVQELEQGGYIDKATAKRLLDFPDVDAELALGNAAMDDADAMISSILDEPTPKMPTLDAFSNLELVLSRGLAHLLYAKHHGAEEERLKMLRDLLTQATAMLNKAKTPPPPPPAPAGPPPMPPPGPGGPMVNVNVPQAPAVPPVIAQ